MRLAALFQNFISIALVALCFLSSASASDVGAGMEHNVVLKADGTVWSWGENYSGQLGNGSNVSSAHPVQVSLLDDVVEISVGGYHTLALKGDGTVWAWGNNRKGQIGDGTVENSAYPVEVTGLGSVVSIDAGMYHSMALTREGLVWVWGGNSNGQLGNGSFEKSPVPLLVNSISAVKEIIAGDWSSYALDNNDAVWLWGHSSYGEPHISTTASTLVSATALYVDWQDIIFSESNAQEIMLPDQSVVVVSQGIEHSLMLRPDGVILESGFEDYYTEADAIPIQTSGGLPGAKEVKWTGAVTMDLTPQLATGEGAKWRVGGHWYSSGDKAYLVEGTHTIEFGSGDGWLAPTPLTVDVVRGSDVTLSANFVASLGSLSITLDPVLDLSNQAKWRIRDGVWKNSGDVLTGLEAGEYWVEFLDVSDWRAPEALLVNIVTNETVSVNAEYKQQKGVVIVNLRPNDVVPLGSKWRVDGGRWFTGEAAIVELDPGSYSLEFSDVDGWQTPAPVSIDVDEHGLAVTAQYTQAGTGAAAAFVGSGVGPFVAQTEPTPDPVTVEEPVVIVVPNPAPVDEPPVVHVPDPVTPPVLVEEPVVAPSPVVDPLIDPLVDQPSEPLPTFAVARHIDVDTVATEVLEKGIYKAATIEYVGAASFYTLDVVHGRKYLFRSAAEGAVQVSFYDTSGQLNRTYAAQEGQVFNFAWIAPETERYFIKVEFNDGWSTGPIQLSHSERGVRNDFNSDGESDVLGRDEHDALSLLYMEQGKFGGSVFTEYQVNRSLSEGWEIKLLDDFDGDLDTDILWRASSGHTAIWLMDGERLDEGSGLTSEYVSAQAGSWDVVDSGDFNGDGKADLLWRHKTSGQYALWMMDGVNVLNESGLLPNQAGGVAGWQVDDIGDFNGDGRSDLLWRHMLNGQIAVWFMDGLNTLDNSGLVTDHFVSHESHWQVVAVDDFDADGKSDVLWHNSREGYLYIWFMDGTSVASSDYVTNYVDPNSVWNLVQVGDYNGDGKADLLWQGNESKQLYTWLMSGIHPIGDIETVTDGADLGKWKVLGK